MAQSWKLPKSALRRVALTAGIVALNLVLVFTIGITPPDDAAPTRRPAAAKKTKPGHTAPQPYATVPPAGPAAPPDDPTTSEEAALDSWAKRMAAATGLPASTVSASGRAQMWMRHEYPDCHVSWTGIAAVGKLDPATTEITDESAHSVASALCAEGTDMRTPRGWWTAVVGYRDSVGFARRVFGLARDYAHAAR